jgi:hypothetical protein
LFGRSDSGRSFSAAVCRDLGRDCLLELGGFIRAYLMGLMMAVVTLFNGDSHFAT